MKKLFFTFVLLCVGFSLNARLKKLEEQVKTGGASEQYHLNKMLAQFEAQKEHMSLTQMQQWHRDAEAIIKRLAILYPAHARNFETLLQEKIVPIIQKKDEQEKNILQETVKEIAAPPSPIVIEPPTSSTSPLLPIPPIQPTPSTPPAQKLSPALQKIKDALDIFNAPTKQDDGSKLKNFLDALNKDKEILSVLNDENTSLPENIHDAYKNGFIKTLIEKWQSFNPDILRSALPGRREEYATILRRILRVNELFAPFVPLPNINHLSNKLQEVEFLIKKLAQEEREQRTKQEFRENLEALTKVIRIVTDNLKEALDKQSRPAAERILLTHKPLKQFFDDLQAEQDIYNQVITRVSKAVFDAFNAQFTNRLMPLIQKSTAAEFAQQAREDNARSIQPFEESMSAYSHIINLVIDIALKTPMRKVINIPRASIFYLNDLLKELPKMPKNSETA